MVSATQRGGDHTFLKTLSFLLIEVTIIQSQILVDGNIQVLTGVGGLHRPRCTYNFGHNIWAVIRHHAGKQVSRLKLFCMMAYQVNIKE